MARRFDDGSTQYLMATGAPISGPPFTFAGWVNTDDVTHDSMIVSCGNSGGGDYFGLYVAGATAGDPINMITRGVAAGYAASSTSGVTANTWHHAVGQVVSATEYYAYIDGANRGSNNQNAGAITVNRTSIGVSADNTPYAYCSGAIAEPVIYDCLLSYWAIRALARGVPPWMIYPNHWLGFWLPMGHAYRSDRDFSRNRIHMTAYNAPLWTLPPPRVLAYRQMMVKNNPVLARDPLWIKFHPEMCIHIEGYVAAGPVTGNPWYAYAQQ